MLHESFHRLPETTRILITDGLDREIEEGFERIERAQKEGAPPEAIRSFEGDILRVSDLRKQLTGEDA